MRVEVPVVVGDSPEMAEWRRQKAVAEAVGGQVPDRPAISEATKLAKGTAKCGWCMSRHHEGCLVNLVVDGAGTRAGCACSCSDTDALPVLVG
jgi:hypothetical protein